MASTRTKVGYIRVSTIDQRTDRQLDGIELDRVFEDRVSGKNMKDRPQLAELIKYVREGDEVFVHSMDRLARNLEDLLQIVRMLTDKGVKISFLKENLSFDPDQTAAPMSKLILSVMGAVAEFERSLILERQREGIALAKERGAYKGRAKKVTPELLNRAKVLLASGCTVSATAKELEVSRASLYRWFGAVGEPLASWVIKPRETPL
jgi:DNA invertase Pin-like site-specific DNA recombinase